jgi:hypothetical protein
MPPRVARKKNKVVIDVATVEPRHLRELADLIERRRWERAGAIFDSVWAEWEAELTAKADPATNEAFDRLMRGEPGD